MNTFREEAIEQLRAMIAGRGDGIDLDTPTHWAIEGLKQPVPFFEHLPALLPSDSILYVEGTRIAPEVAAFYAEHRAPNAVAVRRDRISPVPDIYHFSFSAEVSRHLGELAGRLPVPAMCDHFKAYRGETLLIYWHDAFDNTLRVSELIPEDTVARFCRALGATCRREETGQWDPERLREVLHWFEHHDLEIPVAGGPEESWWRRAWRRLTGRW